MNMPGAAPTQIDAILRVEITGETERHNGRYAVRARVPSDVRPGSTVMLPVLNTGAVVQSVIPCPADGPPTYHLEPIHSPRQHVRSLVRSGWFHYPAL
jgi:hypothetical protein